MEYNGIQVFDGGGYKLPDEIEDEIEAVICGKADAGIPAPTGIGIGRKVTVPNAVQGLYQLPERVQ